MQAVYGLSTLFRYLDDPEASPKVREFPLTCLNWQVIKSGISFPGARKSMITDSRIDSDAADFWHSKTNTDKQLISLVSAIKP